MSELLISLLAALFGVLIDRLVGLHRAAQHRNETVETAVLRRRLAVDRVNRQVDKNVARETDLNALIDRL